MVCVEQADVPSRRAGNARQYAKKQKAKAKRRAWKNLREDEESPRKSVAYDGKYRGWIS